MWNADQVFRVPSVRHGCDPGYRAHPNPQLAFPFYFVASLDSLKPRKIILLLQFTNGRWSCFSWVRFHQREPNVTRWQQSTKSSIFCRIGNRKCLAPPPCRPVSISEPVAVLLHFSLLVDCDFSRPNSVLLSFGLTASLEFSNLRVSVGSILLNLLWRLPSYACGTNFPSKFAYSMGDVRECFSFA